MKTVAVCVFCALGAFVMAHLHISGQLGEIEDDFVPPPKVAEVPRAKYPDDLFPAARGKPIPQAADYRKTASFHPTVVLTQRGTIHEWNERLPHDWVSDSVENTELVLVLADQQKEILEVITYPPVGKLIPPPVRRYKHTLDAWLMFAKKGEDMSRKRFVSIARSVRPREHWDLTELGDPVTFGEVIAWMKETTATYAREN
jgi:hypothetical protein